MTSKTYRAAYVGEAVLTGPEHADLPDAELIAEAVAEAKHAGIYGDAAGKDADGNPLGITEDDIQIGEWRE